MLSRRAFLKAASLVAVPALGVGFPRAFAQGSELPALNEVPLDRSEPGLARGQLVAAHTHTSVDGRLAWLTTYNGSFPGPLLRLRPGETVQLALLNRLPETTNLHFHGMALPPTGRADNIWIQVPAGARFDYEFTVSARDGGLHWFHPHVHGAMARQMFAGLTGAILVEDAPAIADALRDADEHVLVLKDISLDGERVQPHRNLEWPVGKEGELLLVNGVAQPRVLARRSLLRLRLLNASNARYWRLRLDQGRLFHVLAEDGHFLDQPVDMEELFLVPGARIEALVDLSDGRPAVVWYHPSARRGHTFTAVQPLLTLEPPARGTPVRIPVRLGNLPQFDAGDVARRRTLLLSLLNICGKPFGADRVDIDARLDTREIWAVRNVDLMDHTFHLHTWHFHPLALNGAALPVRAVRDSVNLRPGDTLELGVHFREFGGRTVYHCHMTEHSDKGMMGVIQVL